jgi:hypothetical protein
MDNITKLAINSYHKMKLKDMSKVLDLDEQTTKYKFILKDDNNDIPTLNIIDKTTDKTIMSEKFQTIGIYNHKSSVWHWAWNISFINRKEYEDIIHLRKLYKTIENNLESYKPDEAEEFYFYSKQHNFYCTAEILPSIIKFAMFVTKGRWFFPIEKKSEGNNITQYVMIM